MKFLLDDDAIYVWLLEQSTNGDIHLKVKKKGDSVSWYVFTVQSKDGVVHLAEGIPTKFGFPLGTNGTLKLSK